MLAKRLIFHKASIGTAKSAKALNSNNIIQTATNNSPLISESSPTMIIIAIFYRSILAILCHCFYNVKNDNLII